MSNGSQDGTWGLNAANVWERKFEPQRAPLFQAIIAATGAGPGKSLLDAGCGAGSVALAAHRAGAKAFGCDSSDAMVAVAGRAAVTGLHEGQQAAGGISRCDIRIHINGELVRGSVRANAVERFAINVRAFTTEGEADSSHCHQVAFVGRINEHLRAIDGPVFHDDLCDALAGFGDGSKTLVEAGHDADFRKPGFKNFTGDVRLEVKALGLAVTLADAAIEFARHATDSCLVADVRCPESSRGQPTQVRVEYRERSGFAHALRLHDGCHATGGSAVNTDVTFHHWGGAELAG